MKMPARGHWAVGIRAPMCWEDSGAQPRGGAGVGGLGIVTFSSPLCGWGKDEAKNALERLN
jgi:hypothetical protein